MPLIKIKNHVLFCFAFCITVSGLTGCSECIVLKFDPGETFWADAYEEGDTIVFALTSDSLKRDTLLIARKIHSIPDGKCNGMVTSYDCEAYFITSSFTHDTSLDTGVYFIQYTKTVESDPPVLRVFNLEYSRGKITDTTVTLTSGYHFKDCFWIPKNSCTHIYPETGFRIKEMVWSKTAGLILYFGERGEKYEIEQNVTKKIRY